MVMTIAHFYLFTPTYLFNSAIIASDFFILSMDCKVYLPNTFLDKWL